MLFIGAFSTLVLPLFLVLSARIVAKSSFGRRPGGIILQAIFYLFAGMAILTFVMFVTQIIRNT